MSEREREKRGKKTYCKPSWYVGNQIKHYWFRYRRED